MDCCARAMRCELERVVSRDELAQLMVGGKSTFGGDHAAWRSSVNAAKAFVDERVSWDRLRIETQTERRRIAGEHEEFRTYSDDYQDTRRYVHPSLREPGSSGRWVHVRHGSGPVEALPEGARPLYEDVVREVIDVAAVDDAIAQGEWSESWMSRPLTKWLEHHGASLRKLADAEIAAGGEQSRVNRTRLAGEYEFFDPVKNRVRNFDETFKALTRGATPLLAKAGVSGYLTTEVAAAAARLTPPLTFRRREGVTEGHALTTLWRAPDS